MKGLNKYLFYLIVALDYKSPQTQILYLQLTLYFLLIPRASGAQ